MAVTIRLKRFGKPHHPTYRIVAIDKDRKRQGREIEIVGVYDPNFDPPKIKVDKKRVEYWLSVGATVSETVRSIFKKTYGRIPKLFNTSTCG